MATNTITQSSCSVATGRLPTHSLLQSPLPWLERLNHLPLVAHLLPQWLLDFNLELKLDNFLVFEVKLLKKGLELRTH
jgi:hypothetical protein